jgi:hypothetical protein
MATPQRQIALDSHDARTPMNGEARTDLIQLIAGTESLSSDADLASEPEATFRPLQRDRSLRIAK